MKVRKATPEEWNEISLAVRDEWYEKLEDDEKVKDFYQKRFSHSWAKENVEHYVLLDGDDIKSSLIVYDFPFILMNKKIRIGGIGEVVTRKGERKKGYAGHLLASVHDKMVERGFDIALLFADIPEFYRKFDYHPLNTRELEASLDEFVSVDKPEGMTFRDMREEDKQRVGELYNAEAQGKLLFLLREDKYWDYIESKRNLAEKYLNHDFSKKVSVDKEGDICSYLVIRRADDELRLMEYAFCAGHKKDIRYLLYREMKKAMSKNIETFKATAPTRLENFCPFEEINVNKRQRLMVKGINSSLTIGPEITHDDYFLWSADSF